MMDQFRRCRIIFCHNAVDTATRNQLNAVDIFLIHFWLQSEELYYFTEYFLTLEVVLGHVCVVAVDSLFEVAVVV